MRAKMFRQDGDEDPRIAFVAHSSKKKWKNVYIQPTFRYSVHEINLIKFIILHCSLSGGDKFRLALAQSATGASKWAAIKKMVLKMRQREHRQKCTLEPIVRKQAEQHKQYMGTLK